eukprot:TRINITY_DN49049_c0_g1_i2.p1 TRINITY_DN49049_c0_g1~~TRINITY_DN49049_c0_g1_i2.p1  ORF type:complete len:254 (-),score=25.36 TRINITY_DN49049_c0_g1_i2:65-826(-)
MALLTGGGYAEFCAVDERLLMPIPTNLSTLQAAAIPETWLTAFQLLTLVGQVRRGDTVLVHAAGSGVGIAAIQLASTMGARVIACAGTDSKLSTASTLGAIAVVNYKTTSAFSEEVLAASEGKGVDLILDPVGEGKHMDENCKALAIDGRWVLYGLMGGTAPSPALLSSLLSKRASFKGTTLRARTMEYKERLIQQFTSHALPKFSDGTYRPLIDNAFTLEEADAAHAYMERDVSNGKIILAISGDIAKRSSL